MGILKENRVRVRFGFGLIRVRVRFGSEDFYKMRVRVRFGFGQIRVWVRFGSETLKLNVAKNYLQELKLKREISSVTS